MAKLPPIHTLTACPHCGSETFYVMQAYAGKGVYHRRFDGFTTDNSGMYDALRHKAGKRAFCSECETPLASWDEDTDARQYCKDDSRDRHG
ncbi:hypothetical protein IVE04_24170 [Pseudomonas mendocina]|nr:hypothetical protein [Pseudomonas mendocina]